MDIRYKGYTIGKCEEVAYLVGSSLRWLVHTPEHKNMRFRTLKECKEWVNQQTTKKTWVLNNYWEDDTTIEVRYFKTEKEAEDFARREGYSNYKVFAK